MRCDETSRDCGSALERDDAYVIFLSVELDGVGDVGGGFAGFDKLLDSGESKELTFGIHGFGETVGGEEELVAGIEL